MLLVLGVWHFVKILASYPGVSKCLINSVPVRNSPGQQPLDEGCGKFGNIVLSQILS